MTTVTSRDPDDIGWMRRALAEAATAASREEVPVSAILVRGGALVATASNSMRAADDATAHAEVLALRAGMRSLRTAWLADCTLYVTLEPCAMCAGAIVLARVSRVVFGAWDDKAGMAGSVGDLLRHPSLNHRPDVSAGVLAGECAALLSAFFAARRRPA